MHVLFLNLHSRGERGEKGRSANFKTKHTEPLTPGLTPPLYNWELNFWIYWICYSGRCFAPASCQIRTLSPIAPRSSFGQFGFLFRRESRQGARSTVAPYFAVSRTPEGVPARTEHAPHITLIVTRGKINTVSNSLHNLRTFVPFRGSTSLPWDTPRKWTLSSLTSPSIHLLKQQSTGVRVWLGSLQLYDFW